MGFWIFTVVALKTICGGHNINRLVTHQGFFAKLCSEEEWTVDLVSRDSTRGVLDATT